MTTDQAAGARLRLERERLGLSQLALATRAGTSTTTVYGAERYGRTPGLKVRARIARALGVDPEVIWGASERGQAPARANATYSPASRQPEVPPPAARPGERQGDRRDDSTHSPRRARRPIEGHPVDALIDAGKASARSGPMAVIAGMSEPQAMSCHPTLSADDVVLDITLTPGWRPVGKRDDA